MSGIWGVKPVQILDTSVPVVVENVRTPVWGNAAQTSIVCMVKFAGMSDELPFSADPTDPEPHGRALYQDLISGRWGDIGPCVVPTGP